MGLSLRDWNRRHRSTGALGGILFLVGALGVLVFLAVLAVLCLFLMALVGVVMGAERLLGLLFPAYSRRRRQRYLSMPRVLIRTVRFGSRPTQMIEARSYELPSRSIEAPGRGRLAPGSESEPDYGGRPRYSSLLGGEGELPTPLVPPPSS